MDLVDDHQLASHSFASGGPAEDGPAADALAGRTAGPGLGFFVGKWHRSMLMKPVSWIGRGMRFIRARALRRLARHTHALLEAVSARREELNHHFAQALVQWSPAPGSEVIPIEHILREVVTPAATLQPVLLIVLDGMSFAVFRELAADLASTAGPWRTWKENQELASPQPPCPLSLNIHDVLSCAAKSMPTWER